MSQEIRAIFENGLFRPLDPVSLAEHDMVSLVVTSPANGQKLAGQNQVSSAGNSTVNFDDELDPLLFDGPSLPANFSRADIYADHD